MNPQEKVDMIKEALSDHAKGELSDQAILTIIRMVIHTVKPSEEDLARARKLVAEYPEWNSFTKQPVTPSSP